MINFTDINANYKLLTITTNGKYTDINYSGRVPFGKCKSGFGVDQVNSCSEKIHWICNPKNPNPDLRISDLRSSIHDGSKLIRVQRYFQLKYFGRKTSENTGRYCSQSLKCPFTHHLSLKIA